MLAIAAVCLQPKGGLELCCSSGRSFCCDASLLLYRRDGFSFSSGMGIRMQALTHRLAARVAPSLDIAVDCKQFAKMIRNPHIFEFLPETLMLYD